MAKRPSKIRWDRIQKLRDHLVEFKPTRYRKFEMTDFFRLLSRNGESITPATAYKQERRKIRLSELQANGPACGYACCLAGDALILFGRKDLQFNTRIAPSLRVRLVLTKSDTGTEAARLLGLTPYEERWMFFGEWIPDRDARGTDKLDKATRPRAIKYLNHVLANKTIFMDWRGQRHAEEEAENKLNFYE